MTVYVLLGGLGGLGGLLHVARGVSSGVYEVDLALMDLFLRELWLEGIEEPDVTMESVRECHSLFNSFYDTFSRWFEVGVKDGVDVGSEIRDIMLSPDIGARAVAVVLNESVLEHIQEKFNVRIEVKFRLRKRA